MNEIYIGMKIAEARKSKGYSQAELAENVAVSPQAVSKWERGESLPDIIMLAKLAEIFGIDINYFISESYTPLIKNADEPQEPKRQSKTVFNLGMANWSGMNFDGVSNIGKKFSVANISNCSFVNSDIQGLQMYGNNTKNCDFSGANLASTVVKACSFNGGNFTSCNLSNTKFSSSNITDCDFTGANFDGVVVSSSTVKNANFLKTNLFESTFKNSDLSKSTIETDITNCVFENCSFSGTIFKNVCFKNTMFKGKKLKNVIFENCTADNITYNFLKIICKNIDGITLKTT